VVAGEVLQSLDGGSVLIGVGRHRIPAQTKRSTRAGQRYLFEVVREGEPLELRVLVEAESSGDGALLRALRSALADEQPLGAMLESLASLLEQESQAQGASNATLQRLLDALSKQLFEPGAGGQQLAEQLRAGGLSYEGRWAELVAKFASTSDATDLGALLCSAFVSELAPGRRKRTSRTHSPTHCATCSRRSPADSTRPCSVGSPAPPAGDLPAKASALLQRAASQLAQGPQQALLFERLRALGLDSWPANMRRALIEALVGARSSSASALILRGSARGGRAVARLESRALARAPRARARTGSQRGRTRAVERRSGAAAQRRAQRQRTNRCTGACRCSTVRPGPRRTCTCTDDGGNSGHKGDGTAHSHRMALSVEFSRTGPVHVDLLLRDDALAVRVLVARDEVAEHLRARLPELEQHLAFGGRAVQTTLAIAPEAQLRREDGVRDVAFLRDHHVMDLFG
jgi:hypothetical protein